MKALPATGAILRRRDCLPDIDLPAMISPQKNSEINQKTYFMLLFD
jgi:hypothetical protein